MRELLQDLVANILKFLQHLPGCALQLLGDAALLGSRELQAYKWRKVCQGAQAEAMVNTNNDKHILLMHI